MRTLRKKNLSATQWLLILLSVTPAQSFFSSLFMESLFRVHPMGNNNPLNFETMKTNHSISTRGLLMSLLLFIVMMPAMAWGKTISGTITDENAQPMPGVSVVVKGTTRGTISNINGYYSIAINPGDQTLSFSFIGYTTIDKPITDSDVMNVTMIPHEASLEECVVTGYATQRKACITGASISVPYKGKKEQYAQPSVEYDIAYDMDVQAPAEFNTENYAAIHENGFKSVASAPLSTFSVDVDRASYTNVRRYLNNGQMPPMDAVRIEEMINYFDYNYPQPTNTDPFAVHTEMTTCPWNAENLIMKIGIKGREFDKKQLPASNLVFLIDVSGSMEDANKLPLLKSALGLLVNELRPTDRIAMVVYAGAAGLVLPSTPGNQKKTIMDALDRLQAGGSTAGGEGLKLAYEVARNNFVKGGNNRIILATDGDFNIGQSSNAEMERLVEKEREGGTAITVLGFGMGNYKDDRMEIIANKGNGNYSYIDNLQEAEKTLVKEFGGTLFTIAKDVKLQLEFNPAKVAAYRLIGYENRVLNNEDFNDDKKDAGEIGAGHTVTALYEIVPMGAPTAGKYQTQTDPLKYQAQPPYNNLGGEWLTVKLRYKQPDGDTSKLLSHVVSGTPLAFDEASDDLRFAAGVACFGMMLRNSEHKGSLTWDNATTLATNAKGTDTDGYRAEMVRLMKTARQLDNKNMSMGGND